MWSKPKHASQLAVTKRAQGVAKGSPRNGDDTGARPPVSSTPCRAGTVAAQPSAATVGERREDLGASREARSTALCSRKKAFTQQRHSRRQRSAPEKTQPDLQMITQNLRGFSKHFGRTTEWFDGFRRLHGQRPLDVVVVQETRATEQWVGTLQDRYTRAWGYRPNQLETPLSFWSTTPIPAAGVAILLHPQSRLEKVKPWHEEHWSEWFIAVQGEINGKVATVASIYGSTNLTVRENTFTALRQLAPPPGTLYLGGDFNCVLDPELDRSQTPKSRQLSPALQTLLEHWRLVDAATEEMLCAETADSVVSFRERHHIYRYGLDADGVATARLDRWYVSADSYSQVMEVAATEPVSRSDHDSVVLGLRTTAMQRPGTRHRIRGLRYPLLACAEDAIHERGRQMLSQDATALHDLCPEQAAHEWDALKERIRRDSLVLQSEKRAAATTRYQTRIQRLSRALKTAKAAVGRLVSNQPSSVTVVTEGMDSLTLDPLARLNSIRDELIAIKTAGSAARRRQRNDDHSGPPHTTSKAFFKRISKQYRMARQSSLPARPGRPPCDPDLQDEFFRQLPPPKEAPDFSALSKPFTVEEIQAAILQCPKGRASGPDGILNDWYRALADPIAAALTPLFTRWYSTGVLPPSFYGATIYCLAKTNQPTTGLDFRPIALLNSDYKIYARAILNRIRDHVGDIVAPTQFGFVKGRQVHDAVDVWTAVQALVADGVLPPSVIAIMLDFAKAYDTLDRRFLHLALERHGLPPELVHAVDTMHLATTAAYLADGQLSRSQKITTGIRQGCPLAPLLFLLAVHVLYELVDACPRLEGVNLSPMVKVKLVGFAHDTTSYLRSLAEERVLRELLDQFAAVSGLVVNLRKSKALSAARTGFASDATPVIFGPARPDERFRYLGILISSKTDSAAVWKTTLQQLTARLHLATIKTTNVLQRVQLSRAIIIPKLLFVARHYWPGRDQVRTLQQYVHNYVRFGSTKPGSTTRKAWMSADAAQQPKAEGGLEVPNVLTELMLMSTRTTSHWLEATTRTSAAVATILLRQRTTTSKLAIAPGRTTVSQLRHGATLASTGVAVIKRALACPVDDVEPRLTAALRQRAGTGSSAEFQWDAARWLTRDYAAHNGALDDLRRHQAETYGSLNVPALLHTPVIGCNLLTLHTATPLTARDLPGLPVAEARVGDVLEIAWAPGHSLRFKYRLGSYPLAPGLARSFRKLCDLLVANCPAILSHHQPASELSVQPPSREIWHVREVGNANQLIRDPGPAEQNLGRVGNLATAERLARRTMGNSVLTFAPHPLLSPILPLWGTTRSLRTRSLRPLLQATTAAAARAENDSRRTRSHEQHPEIGAGLSTLKWKTIHRLPHTSSRQRLLLHQVKGLRLSGYDKTQARRGCPHCPRLGANGGRMSHILWTCPKAQELWRTLRVWWRSLRAWPERDAADRQLFLHSIFSLKLQSTPPGV